MAALAPARSFAAAPAAQPWRLARPSAGGPPPTGAAGSRKAGTSKALAAAVVSAGFAAARRRGGRGLCLRAGGSEAPLSPADDDGGVKVADKEKERDLDYIPTREEAEKEERAIMEASGSYILQKKEEAYWARRKHREKFPSQLDVWEQDMEEMRRDTERRKLWGDLRRKSGGHRRMKGNNVKQKEMEIRFNRGFPVEDNEDDPADVARDKKWIDMWRATWPSQEAVDPHNPESFGFGCLGTITGAHGLWGDVRVRADDDLVNSGYDVEQHLQHRNFKNWTEKAKRIHLKAPHRRFPRPYKIIRGVRVQRRVYSLQLKGVETIEQAESLIGYKVYMLEAPPGEGENALDDSMLNEGSYDLYDSSTTHFAIHDAQRLVGCNCKQIIGNPSDEVLAEFAAAENQEAAEKVLEDNGLKSVRFGELTGVVPYYAMRGKKIRRKMEGPNLLDITLDREVKGGEDRSLRSQKFVNDTADNEIISPMEAYLRQKLEVPPGFDRVVYVPFVPDLIARVESGENLQSTTVHFVLPQKHIERTSFTCRSRIMNEAGLISSPRGADVAGLLPPPGKSHTLRRRDGKRRPFAGTAPPAPEGMQHPAGIIAPDFGPGVPEPPTHRPNPDTRTRAQAPVRRKKYQFLKGS